MRIALLASGRGSNARALLAAKAAGRLPAADFVVVVSNVEGAGVLEVAAEFGVPPRVVPHRGLTRSTHEQRVLAVLDEFHVEAVALAGYMRVLTPLLVGRFAGRMLNIHPALLPAFPGVEAQRQAWEYGAKVAGCTVHFVDEGVDSGPIVAQTAVPVLDDDTTETLAARILKQEHRLYAEALDLFTRGRLRLDGRRVLRRPD